MDAATLLTIFTGVAAVAILITINVRHHQVIGALQNNHISSQALFQGIVQGSDDAIVSKTLGGIVTSWNDAAQRIFGYSAEEMIGQSVSRLIPPELQDEEPRILARILNGESIDHYETIRVRKDGQRIDVSLTVSPVRDAAGKIVSVSKIARDISDRRRSQDRLRNSEEEYRLLFDSNPSPMWVIDNQTQAVLAVNEEAIRRYGYSRAEFLGMTPGEIGDSSRHRKKNGTFIDVEVAASPIQFRNQPAQLMLANDITDRNTLQSQFLQAQRMESVGLLAGGVAHDFNNLLGVVIGSAEMLQWDLHKDAPGQEYVSDVLKAARRAADLTRALLAFSRKQVLQPDVHSLSGLVCDFETILRRVLPENIEIKTSLRSEWSVYADAGQIEQVIMNLAVNARDAMPSGGCLSLETSDVEVDEIAARQYGSLQPGRYVLMAISDTGHGMEADVQARIFDPFFTTKERGRGTGLGLGSVHGIVKQSGGSIFVTSERDVGTTFKIFLPLVQVNPTEGGSLFSPEHMPRGTETILLAEDESTLRNIVSSVLKGLGYNVLSAANGVEAVRVAESYAESIDLLLTDVVMPGMGGRELAKHLLQSRPGVPVIYLSGYTDDAAIAGQVSANQSAFLQKPFASADLAQKVRQVLQAAAVIASGNENPFRKDPTCLTQTPFQPKS